METTLEGIYALMFFILVVLCLIAFILNSILDELRRKDSHIVRHKNSVERNRDGR